MNLSKLFLRTDYGVALTETHQVWNTGVDTTRIGRGPKSSSSPVIPKVTQITFCHSSERKAPDKPAGRRRRCTKR
jgi:hypothetical protein